MAYAALLSLSRTIDEILVFNPYLHLFKKEKLVPLQNNVCALQKFLEEYWDKHKGVVNPLEIQIIDAAYRVEDIIEYYIQDNTKEPESLPHVLLEIDSILEDAIKLKNKYSTENVLLSAAPSLFTDNSSDVNTSVSEDDFLVIRERIYDKYCNSFVIPIVGMGGIGKTTLARRLYEDCEKDGFFDRCVWVTVSQNYSRKKLLSDIIISLGKPDIGGDLMQVIHQELIGRRYVIVVDDLWSENVWEDLYLILPRDTAGSRVLITTRLYQVASYVGNLPHEVQLLNEHQSWKLFEERVFGEDLSCPSKLEQIGKRVVKGCRGLPLMIVLIAGILKRNITEEYWNSISNNISLEPSIENYCSRVMKLSYNHLPLFLRPCFLYMTVFPEDYEIKTNRLIRLWMAEGFVRASRAKLLEDVAYEYLQELVGRSLILVSKKTNGRIKTVRLHDMCRDFGILISQEDRFHYHRDFRPEYRRVTPYNAFSLRLLLSFHKPTTRSVLIPFRRKGYYSFDKLKLLRVWDACRTDLMCYYTYIPMLIRYLSIPCDCSLLTPISKLQNIQTLIIDPGKKILSIPPKIWMKPSLRHLIFSSYCQLEQPCENVIFKESSLQTIRSVIGLSFTKEVVAMIMNLRKLKVKCNPPIIRIQGKWIDMYDHNSISFICLRELEKLTIRFSSTLIPITAVAFPQSLKKLSIKLVGGSWKHLSEVGVLVNLEVFKLISFYPTERVWAPTEGQFLKLKHLEFDRVVLDSWEADSMHFPNLEILVLKCMRGALNEIPEGLGEIDTLKVIKLALCRNSFLDSAKRIQFDKWEMGNEDLQLLVSDSRKKGAKYKAIRPEEH